MRPWQRVSADAVNAFNAQYREAMRAALLANPALHGLLDLFDMLYRAGGGRICVGSMAPQPVHRCSRFVAVAESGKGALWAPFLFCLTMAPIYDRIRAMVGDAGVLLAFSDDAYCISSPVLLAAVLKELTPLYRIVGLRIGWGSHRED